MEEIRQAEVYGVRPKRTWEEAATKYLNEATKATLGEDAGQLEYLDEYIEDLPLEAVQMGTLQRFIEKRKHQGGRKDEPKTKDVRKRTINSALQTVRHILNLAASEWLDEKGQTWLVHAPKIKLLREDDKKEPFLLPWDEQERLFAELPQYPQTDRLVRGEHELHGSGSVPPQMEVGASRSGTGHQRVHHSR
jgi:hypothetical protein